MVRNLRSGLCLALVLVVTLSGASSAGAQVSAGDSVVGEAGQLGLFKVWIDARGGPYGESPTGTVSWHGGGGLGPSWEGRPTCLAVIDNTAVIGLSGTLWESGIGRPMTAIVRVVDYDGWFDTFEQLYDADSLYPPPGTPPKTLIPAPTDCSSFPGAFPLYGAPSPPMEVLEPGGLVVIDAPVPAPRPPEPPTVSVEHERDLQWVLSRGITLELTCESACRLRARLYLGARQARRHGLTKGRKPVAIAKANGHLTKAGDLSAIVTFNPRSRKRLKHARALKLVLKTTLTAADYTRTRTHPLRLKAKRD